MGFFRQLVLKKGVSEKAAREMCDKLEAAGAAIDYGNMDGQPSILMYFENEQEFQEFEGKVNREGKE